MLSAEDFDLTVLLREMGAESFSIRVNVGETPLDGTLCFECDHPAEGWHHPVPRSRGGKLAIPLCAACHAKAHHVGHNMAHRTLTKQGLQRAKARGVKLGSARPGAWEGREHLRGFKQATERSAIVRRRDSEKKYASLIVMLKEKRAEGLTLDQIAVWLNGKGHSTPTGRPWNKALVCQLFQRHAPECCGRVQKSPLAICHAAILC